MSNKLKFTIEVLKDIETSELLIPPMLLQPYLENAIIHAYIESPRPPELLVQFKKRGSRIDCIIQDNGIGRVGSNQIKKKMSGIKTKSYGLGILKERIDLLNQLSIHDFKLQIQDLHDEDQQPIGTKVRISFDCIYNKLI
jgi:sensor histidine kinase YesM